MAGEEGNAHHRVTVGMAAIQADMDDTDSARRSLVEALDLATEVDAGQTMADIYGALAL